MKSRDLTSWAAALWLCLAAAFVARGADYNEARRQFIAGEYAKCLAQCDRALKDSFGAENWRILAARCYATVGRYPEAEKTIVEALERFPSNVRLRWAGYEVLRPCGQPAMAEALLNEILGMANASPMDYRDAGSLVAVGQAAMLRGADPKQVLDKLFEQAKRREPTFRDAYLAAGALALGKNDFELAATQYREGLERFAQDADFYYGLARAYASSDPGLTTTNLEKALEFNPNHIPARLMWVDHLIDSEEYPAAAKQLDEVATVNAWNPEMWAYRALLARLRNDGAAHLEARDKALRYWKTNPGVDYLIGQKLSRKYRFAEGAVFQRRALKMDPEYLPAKIQLAQDLLRLGEEKEGWRLAEEVFQKDAYDVVAYNLTTLKDTMAKFRWVTNQDFRVRMSEREATVYGDRVLALLDRAKASLTERYGVQVQTPVYVEIFPESKDFAVRTFALPAESGYLGVCFGRVITANSPATQTSSPANWESMLWHEFAHVVTLQMTGNKIPRWLSEGISVYEERQAGSSWGQRLTPSLRDTLLNGGLKKIAGLSAAFMNPKKPADVQFAYFQSSLVVEFLMKRFGIAGVKGVLEDLNQGVELNAALESRLAPLSQIEKEFAQFAEEYAKQMGSTLDWTKPPEHLSGGRRPAQGILESMQQHREMLSSGGAASMEDWVSKNPNNYWALKEAARAHMKAKEWAEAKGPLLKIVELSPNDIGGGSAYWSLAIVCRQLQQTKEEEAALAQLAARDDTAVDAYARLMELAAERKDWPVVLTNASRYLGVNPLVPPPYRYLALAAEALDQIPEAIHAYRVLLFLDPPDPADVHYRLARLLQRQGDPQAKREVLKALEGAPRFRDAHRLLAQLRAPAPVASANPVQSATNEMRAPEPAMSATNRLEPKKETIDVEK